MIEKYILILLIGYILAVESVIDNSNFDDDVMFYLLNRNNYSSLVRPSKKVMISFQLSYRQLLSLDEKAQIMTSNVYLFVSWYDSRLEWDSDSYGNLTEIYIPSNKLWMPDLAVINTASTSVFIPINDSNLALVTNDGIVLIVINLPLMQTRCKVNVYKFPFDRQECPIIIGSWLLDRTRVDFMSDDSKIYTADYIPSAVWNLEKIEVFTPNASVRATDNDDIGYYVTLKRRPLYYMTTFIPCYILNIATLLAFFVTNSIVLQVNLCMSVFLTFGVYSLKIAGDITTQSEYFPLANIYFIMAIVYTLITLGWFICANYFLTRNKLPKWLAFIAKYFQIILFCAFPKEKIESKSSIDKFETNEVVNNTEINNSNDNLRNRRIIQFEKLPKIGCNKCEVCEDCDKANLKENEKKKEKALLESYIFALNILVFLIVFTIMLATYLAIWIAVSS